MSYSLMVRSRALESEVTGSKKRRMQPKASFLIIEASPERQVRWGERSECLAHFLGLC